LAEGALPARAATAGRVAARGRRRLGAALVLAVLLVGGLLQVAPLLYMASVSLMSRAEIALSPTPLLPAAPRFENYALAWSRIRYPVIFMNTLTITVAVVGAGLALKIISAYALARLRFPGRDLLFMLLLGTLMIPRQVTMIPIYILLARWPLAGGNDLFGAGGHGLLDSYWAVVAPTVVAQAAFGTFLLRQAFLTIPQELEDAALIDGCSTWRVIWQVYVPLSGPILATIVILNVIQTWNDFLWPLVVINSPHLYTLTLGVSTLKGQWDLQDEHLIMAATTMATIPILVVFLVFQRYIIRGITMSGLKG
jgi:multiple sugar transport system permease protein